jgi:ankyrin repeat protein
VPTIPLPMDPDLGQLRKKARELQRAVRAGDAEALALAAEFTPDHPAGATFQLSAAQLVLARRYGFASWPRLRRHVEIVTARGWQPRRPAPHDDLPNTFLRLSCGGYPTTDREDRPGDLRDARDLLAKHPELPAASLAIAAACADVAAVRHHLAADPSLATRGSGPYDWPPLLCQAYARHDPQVGLEPTVATARLLLAAGADPNEGRFWHGQPSPTTPLGGALYSGEGGEAQHSRAVAFARVLLEAGADPNDGSATGLAHSYGGNDDLLELLLEFGLGQDANGPWHRLLGDQMPSAAAVLRFLLFFAIERDQRHRVAQLARHGVDLASPFTDLSAFFEAPHRWPAGTPTAVALVDGNRELARQLINLGAPALEPHSTDAFVAAVMTGDDAAVRSADPAVVETVRAVWPGLPAWAARRGVPESVPLLVKAGFDVNALGRSDSPHVQPWHSALHVAAESGNLALAQRLLDLGANPDLLDAITHATPLSWARESDQQALIGLLEPLTTV